MQANAQNSCTAVSIWLCSQINAALSLNILASPSQDQDLPNSEHEITGDYLNNSLLLEEEEEATTTTNIKKVFAKVRISEIILKKIIIIKFGHDFQKKEKHHQIHTKSSKEEEKIEIST